MLQSSRTCLALSVAALLVTVGAGVRLALHQDPRAVKALRTPGSIIGAVGGSQPLIVGAGWQQVLLRAFPSLEDRIGGELIPSLGCSTSLVIWQNQGKLADQQGPATSLNLELVGDRGESLRAPVWGNFGCSAEGQFRAGYEVTAFPRRGRLVRIRFLDPGPDGKPRPELIVPNPASGRYPVWTPEPLPAHGSIGALQVRLERFETGVAGTDENGGRTLETVTELHIQERGKPVGTGWAVERVALADATGNRWENEYNGISSKHGRVLVTMGPLLLPEEAAYRIEVELARTSGFAADELWTLRDLKVPRSKRVAVQSRSQKLPGGTLELTHLLGSRATGHNWSYENATAVVRVHGDSQCYCLRAGPSPGGELDHDVFLSASGEYGVDLGVKAPQPPTTLTLALTPRHTVTFLAHASRPKPGVSLSP